MINDRPVARLNTHINQLVVLVFVQEHKKDRLEITKRKDTECKMLQTFSEIEQMSAS